MSSPKGCPQSGSLSGCYSQFIHEAAIGFSTFSSNGSLCPWAAMSQHGLLPLAMVHTQHSCFEAHGDCAKHIQLPHCPLYVYHILTGISHCRLAVELGVPGHEGSKLASTLFLATVVFYCYYYKQILYHMLTCTFLKPQQG